ncbi:vWA domain-containing protein [Nevskia sp.]|uniref:vWA domain-containing protein n=1 Tax=Nevskia sp. TaxID=1929292 RepID=UPI003F72AD5F
MSRPHSTTLIAACCLGAAAALAACSAPPAQRAAAEPISAPPSVAQDVVPAAAEAPTEAPLPAPAQALALAKAQTREAQATTRMAPPPMAVATEQWQHMPAPLPAPSVMPDGDGERYAELRANPVWVAAEQPVSTFSVDVDTGAYANVRRLLNAGQLPPRDAVRVEELINYFDYAYAPPKDRATPFALHTELGPTPWNPKTELLAIGIQGWKPAAASIRPSNLVFLVDVSGSMQSADKLPLVKASLKLLAGQLTARDRISLVVYAGRTEVVLEPTPGDQTATIVAALDRLEAGGSTDGASGIQLAYAMAEKAFMKDGNNRVLLATDGDFNVGLRDVGQLKEMVENKRRNGVALSTLGFGTGNYNDALMEQIADVGNGHYSYIDSAREAQRVLVEERASALETIASDVKIQVEFNPAVVAEYRLIGYENRLLRREDFNNDAIDAGDIGAGHRVTALYEIARVGSGGEKVDALRYGQAAKAGAGMAGELAQLKLRYKRPEDGVDARSRLIARVVRADEAVTADRTSPAFRLAAAVAAYGQLLRGGEYTQRYALRDAAALASAAQVDQASGRAAEFVELARLAASLNGERLLVSGDDHHAGAH